MYQNTQHHISEYRTTDTRNRDVTKVSVKHKHCPYQLYAINAHREPIRKDLGLVPSVDGGGTWFSRGG